jgi:DNA helicase-2/ATP-dependent DNA helicase PcrA
LNHSEPSRFLEEIDPEFAELPEDLEPYEERSESFGSHSWNRFGGRPGIRAGQAQQRRETLKKPAEEVKPVPAGMKKISQASSSGGSTLPPGSVMAGAQVEHAKFGKGKVLKVEGDPPNEKATVFFPSVGQKQLLLKFAKLKLV